MENMRFKVGDRVRIKSLDWYNENKNNKGIIVCGSESFTHPMSYFCNKVVSIITIQDNCYRILEDDGDWYWTDEMIEGLVESVEDRMKELRKMCTISLTDSNYTDKIEVLLNDYEYIEENGKAYFVRKKKEYPKTYEECCKILDWNHRDYDRVGYESELLCKLQVLLLCRDAYWKVAGEEMGLDGPWEPDWSDYENIKYIIGGYDGEIGYDQNHHIHKILAFPTEEMRDAFYDNFKELIESCKELL